MSGSRKTVYTLGFSLAMSFMGAAAWAADEQPAEIVAHGAVRQATGNPAPPDSVHDPVDATPLVIGAAYGARSNPNDATGANRNMSDAARRRYFAMRRSADASGGNRAGGGYWRWIETGRRGSAAREPSAPSASRARNAPRYGYHDGYTGETRAPYARRFYPANPAWPNANGDLRRYQPPAPEQVPAPRPYRYQSANGYGYLR